MAFEKGNRPDSPMKRRGGRRRKKVCCTVIGKPMAVFLFKKKRLFSLRGKWYNRRVIWWFVIFDRVPENHTFV